VNVPSDVCMACGGSGVAYCCDNAGVGVAGFVPEPNWIDKTYPIVFAEDQEPRSKG
jgi:hypothetical protein